VESFELKGCDRIIDIKRVRASEILRDKLAYGPTLCIERLAEIFSDLRVIDLSFNEKMVS